KDYLEAIDDPESVLDDIGAGRVARYKIEAIQNVYPNMFAQLQREIQEQAPKMRKQLSQQQMARVETIMQTPVAPMFQPDAIAFYQSTYEQKQQQAAPPKRPLENMGENQAPASEQQ